MSMTTGLKRLENPAVRRVAILRLAHALDLGQKLHDDMHEWWASANPRAEWIVSDDGRAQEFVINVPQPPVERWQLRANDVVQNLRSSLDALARHAAVEFVGGGRKSDVGFPSALTEEVWTQWRGHNVFPPDVIERFRMFQPLVTRRVELDGLRRVSNLEKHDFTVTASCQPSELSANGHVTLEGILSEADLESVRLEMVDPVIRGGRQTVLRIHYPQPIVEQTGEPTEYALSVWLTVPSFTFPDGWEEESSAAAPSTGPTTDIKLLQVLDAWRHEVAWAIAYVTGQYSSSTEEPVDGLSL